LDKHKGFKRTREKEDSKGQERKRMQDKYIGKPTKLGLVMNAFAK
jgi:hypothetical protein